MRINVHEAQSQKATNDESHPKGETGLPNHRDREHGKEQVHENVRVHSEVSNLGTHRRASKVGDSAGVGGADVRGEDGDDDCPNDDDHNGDGEYDAGCDSDCQTVEDKGDGDFDNARRDVQAELIGPVVLMCDAYVSLCRRL